MDSRLTSVLSGGAVAAFLIFPSLAAPAAPPVPPAPVALPAPAPVPAPAMHAEFREAVRAQAEAARAAVESSRAEIAAARAQAHAMHETGVMLAMNADAGQWIKSPTRTYNTKAVRLGDVVGTIMIAVKDSGPMALDVSGSKARVSGLEVNASGDTLRIEGSDVHDVWNWRDWFNFSIHDQTRPDSLTIKVTVPRGADVTIDDLVGNATIGDTMGHLKFEAAATHAKVGKVGKAEISLAGAGKVDVAAVNGPLNLEIAGSGKVTVGPVSGGVNADIAGAGDATIGPVAGGLDIDIAGSGDLLVASVKGPTSVDIAGSGSVKIADGEANPLHVDIMGSGNFDFGGVAVNPRISALGSGNVRLKSYRGNISADGMVTVKVGDKKITVGNDDDD